MGTAETEEGPKFYILESNQTLMINSERRAQRRWGDRVS